MKYKVEILVDRLDPGDLPVYTSDPTEEWYFLDEDGRTWKTFQGRQCHAPEFELAGKNALECTRQIERAIATICLLQEHGGTAIMAVRSFHAVQGPEMTVWSLVGSLIITQKAADELGVVGSERLPGMPAKLEIDEFTIPLLDNAEMVEEVHDF